MDVYDHKLFEFTYVLYGNHALFTNPLTKMSGSKFSYQVPTYQALEGITKNIYWKPSVLPVIESLEVLNEIEYEIENVRLRPADGSSQIGQNMLLKNVRYIVHGYYIPAPDLSAAACLENDCFNAGKHRKIFENALKKGGRMPIFLGASDYTGYVEPYDAETEGQSFYKDTVIPMGSMFYQFDYPNCLNPSQYINRYFMLTVMNNGEIIYPLIKRYTDKKQNLPPEIFSEKIKAEECNFSIGTWYKSKKEVM